MTTQVHMQDNHGQLATCCRICVGCVCTIDIVYVLCIHLNMKMEVMQFMHLLQCPVGVNICQRYVVVKSGTSVCFLVTLQLQIFLILYFVMFDIRCCHTSMEIRYTHECFSSTSRFSQISHFEYFINLLCSAFYSARYTPLGV